jgi:hypothetical protein
MLNCITLSGKEYSGYVAYICTVDGSANRNQYHAENHRFIVSNANTNYSEKTVMSITESKIIFHEDLSVEGVVTSNGTALTSDYRIKQNVENLDDSFVVDKLRPVIYNKNESQNKEIGLIAHEVQEVFPSLVYGDKDGETMQSVNYIGLIPVLIKEIQDLKSEVKYLKQILKSK